MTNQPNKSNEPLEALLKQWGADEAMAKVQVPAPPAVPKEAAGSWLRRWSPMLAAAMILAAASVLFYSVYHQQLLPLPDRDRVAQTPDGESEESQQLLARVDKLQDEVERLRAAKPADQEMVAGASQARPSVAAPATTGPNAERTGSDGLGMATMDSSDKDVDAVESVQQPDEALARLQNIQNSLARQQRRLDEVEKVSTLAEGLAGQLQQTRSRLETESTELARLKVEKVQLNRKNLQLAASVAEARTEQRKLREDIQALQEKLVSLEDKSQALATRQRGNAAPAQAAVRRAAPAEAAAMESDDAGQIAKTDRTVRDELQRKLAELNDRLQKLDNAHQRLRESFEVAYRSSLAPGETGLDAWRTVVTRGKLISRSRQAMQDSSGQTTRKLIEQVEFVLTRLSLAPRDDADIAAQLANLIRQRKLVEMIDSTLQQGQEIQRLNAFLLEARTVLKGILDVS